MRWQMVIPMSGFGERFRRAGYTLPKPLIEVLGKPIIAHVLDMFPGDKDVYCICNQAHLDEPAFDMREILARYCPGGTVIGIEGHKKGPVYAVSRVFDRFSPDAPTVVCYCDFACVWNWEGFKRYATETGCDGAVMCYTGFHPHMVGSANYAYVRNDGDRALSIQEKKPYTDNPMAEYASSGAYYFASGALMREAFEEAMRRPDLRLNGEYYVSLAYVPLLEKGRDIRVFPVERFMQWGTPEDLAEFLYHAGMHRRPETWSTWSKDTAIDGTMLMPMAGLGNRFRQAGYDRPKALLPIDDIPMFLRARADLPPTRRNVFVLRQDFPDLERMQAAICGAYPQAEMRILPGPTDGQAITCLEAMELADPAKPLLIGACDNGYLWECSKLRRLLADPSVDFIAWTMRDYPSGKRHPEMYGWIDAGEDGLIRMIGVKRLLPDAPSRLVITGAFLFRKGEYFARAARRMIGRDGRVNGEFYVDECLNDALALGLKGAIFEVGSYICWGTPDELKTYEYWRETFKTWHVEDGRVAALCKS